MKKLLSLLLVFAFLLSHYGCVGNPGGQSGEAPSDTRSFTDSTGRVVELPTDITRIAVTGPISQITLFALAPDMLVGLAAAWDAGAEQFLSEEYLNLPVLGQLYGGKGELNLEELLKADPQLVIDVGAVKDGTAVDMDALTQRTGIPFVHISMSLSDMGDSYRLLGELLNLQSKADQLAQYCESVYSRVAEIASRVKKAELLYCLGTDGLNVIAKGSFHGEVIDLIANNVAVVDDISSRGTGNEVDMEQLLEWNADYIIFAPEAMVYTTAETSDTWRNMTAIAQGNYYRVPSAPYNWMGFPPAEQRLLGMLWLTKLLYPEEADYDLYDELAKYFYLFCHCTLSQEQFELLVGRMP